jgi:UTP:GlnB (protein PII) uridylyltransferase
MMLHSTFRVAVFFVFSFFPLDRTFILLFVMSAESSSEKKNELVNAVCDRIESLNLQNRVRASGFTRENLVDYVNRHCQALPPRYVVDVTVDDVIHHLDLLNRPLRTNQFLVSCQKPPQSIDPFAVLVTVVCYDKPKIYNRITFALDKYIDGTLDADVMTHSSTGKVNLIFCYRT